MKIEPIIINNKGKWVEKKTLSKILVCESCSAKYIKTRKVQVECLRCVWKNEESKTSKK